MNILIKPAWLLGTVLILVITACGSAEDQISKNEAAAQKQEKTMPDGMAIFRQYCVACHGADGKLGLNGAKDLSQSTLTLEQRITQVTNGKNMMAPYSGILSPEAIKAVAEYTQTLKTNSNDQQNQK